MPARTKSMFLHFLLLALAFLGAVAFWLDTNYRQTTEYRNNIQPIELGLEQKYWDLEQLNQDSEYNSLDNLRKINFQFLTLEAQRTRNLIIDLKMRCIEVEPQTGTARDLRETIVDIIILEQNMADTLNKKLLAQSQLISLMRKLHNEDQNVATHYTGKYIELLHNDLTNEMAQCAAAQEQFDALSVQTRRDIIRAHELLNLDWKTFSITSQQ